MNNSLFIIIILVAIIGGYLCFTKYRRRKHEQLLLTALSIIMHAACNKEALAQMSKEDIEIQKEYWKENLNRIKSISCMYRLVYAYSYTFYPAPSLTEKYKF